MNLPIHDNTCDEGQALLDRSVSVYITADRQRFHVKYGVATT